MSGIALKLSSLLIRTASKPIATAIKRQAREHEGFRRTCISFAQFLHRIDMRMRLGLLRDTAQIEKQAAKEAAEVTAKKHKPQSPTVKTEAEVKAEAEEIAKLAKEKAKNASRPRIRPLSEAKAIESGANFISEAFLFGVAGGLIVFESWRSRRKETTRREDVASRINELEEAERYARRAIIDLEREVLRLREKNGTASKTVQKHIVPREVWQLEEKEEQEDVEKAQNWMERISAYIYRPKESNDQIDQPPKTPDAKPVSAELVKQGVSILHPAGSNTTQKDKER